MCMLLSFVQRLRSPVVHALYVAHRIVFFQSVASRLSFFVVGESGVLGPRSTTAVAHTPLHLIDAYVLWDVTQIT